MGGSSKKVTVGYKYYLGQHMILCHGPADKLVEILVDERRAWLGESTGGQISVNANNLFGGEKREGGVSGAIDVEMGGPEQGRNDYLQARLGNAIPAFRGVVGLVLRQVYVGLNPYLKKWAFRLQRIHTRGDGQPQWYNEKSSIPGGALTRNQSICLVVDYSNSMLEEVAEGVTRLDAVRQGLVAALEYIRDNLVGGNAIDIAFIPFAWKVDESNTRFFYNATTANINTLISLVNTTGTVFGTAFDGAFSRAKDFFDGASTSRARSTLLFLTDGECWQSSFDDPVYYDFNDQWSGPAYDPQTAVEFAIPFAEAMWAQDVMVYGFNLDEANITYTAQLDNTPGDGVPVLDGSNPEAITAALLAVLPLILQDENPAHILRECLTDPDWGLGYPEEDIDEESFQAAANKLWEERWGISLLWDRAGPIEDFINEIRRHIDCELYVDRTTAKWTLKLIRGDYDEDELITLGPGQINRVDDYKRPAPGDLVDSVTVVYEDGPTGKPASVTASDTALARRQGEGNSTTVNYPGFSNHVTAERAAQRDLRALSSDLLSCSIYATDAAEDFRLGDVFKFVWPDYHDGYVVVRITGMVLGDGKKNRVLLSVVEDVFATPEEVLVTTPVTEWEDPAQPPSPATVRMVTEVPYRELVQRLGQANADNQLDLNPFAGWLVAAAGRPPGAISATIATDDGSGYEETGTLDFCPVAFLAVDVGPTDTIWALTSDGLDLDLVETGTHAQAGEEIVRIDGLSGGALTVGRGCLDTVPTTPILPAGTPVFFWDIYSEGGDETERAAGTEIGVKILPVSGSGAIELAQAEEDLITFAQRALRPYPPGNVRINGEPYPSSIDGGDELSVDWSDRDRTQQTSGILEDTTEGDIGPEPGTTYNLRIYGENDDLLRDVSGVERPYVYPANEERDESELPGGSGDLNWLDVVALLSMDGPDESDNFSDATTRQWYPTEFARVSTEQSRFGGASMKLTPPEFDELFLNNVVLHLPLTGENNGTDFPHTNNNMWPKTVTAYGDVKTITSQYRWDGSSADFDGAGDYLEIATSADFDYGTLDFTIEFWFRPTASKHGFLYSRTNDGSSNTYRIDFTADAKINVLGSSNNTTWAFTDFATGAISLDEWHHVALVRSGSTLALYLDGSRVDTRTPLSLTATTQPVRIGGHHTSLDRNFQGQIQDYRITKGLARYTGTTYAVPARAFPWPGKMGALDTADSAGFGFGTGDFTAEAWIRLSSLTVSSVVLDVRLSGQGAGGGPESFGAFSVQTNGRLAASGAGVLYGNSGNSVSLNTWAHVAWVRKDGALRGFLDGVGQWTEETGYAVDLGATRPARIGASRHNAVGATGYIDDVRVTTGVARYWENFTPPIEALPDGSVADFRLNGRLRIESESERDGLVSLQKHNIVVLRAGYGFNYGKLYGGDE